LALPFIPLPVGISISAMIGLIPSHGPAHGHVIRNHCPSRREEAPLTPTVFSSVPGSFPLLSPAASNGVLGILRHVSRLLVPLPSSLTVLGRSIFACQMN
jgi:hypothetical protein